MAGGVSIPQVADRTQVAQADIERFQQQAEDALRLAARQPGGLTVDSAKDAITNTLDHFAIAGQTASVVQRHKLVQASKEFVAAELRQLGQNIGTVVAQLMTGEGISGLSASELAERLGLAQLPDPAPRDFALGPIQIHLPEGTTPSHFDRSPGRFSALLGELTSLSITERQDQSTPTAAEIANVIVHGSRKPEDAMAVQMASAWEQSMGAEKTMLLAKAILDPNLRVDASTRQLAAQMTASVKPLTGRELAQLELDGLVGHANGSPQFRWSGFGASASEREDIQPYSDGYRRAHFHAYVAPKNGDGPVYAMYVILPYRPVGNETVAEAATIAEQKAQQWALHTLAGNVAYEFLVPSRRQAP